MPCPIFPSVSLRALPQSADLPAPHRRFDLVAAPAYLGRKRGEIARTRTTVLQAHTHQWLGTFGNAGNGDYRGELLRARAVISSYATALALPLSHILTRLDGLYGNAAPLVDLLTFGSVQHGAGEDVQLPDVLTRAQRAHWRQSPGATSRSQCSPPYLPTT